MKYLTTTFAIAFMAIGFASIPHAREGYDYSGDGHDCYNEEYGTDCISTTQITDVESIEQVADHSEDGSGGGSGGGDFGEGDRAAASTAAE